MRTTPKTRSHETATMQSWHFNTPELKQQQQQMKKKQNIEVRGRSNLLLSKQKCRL
jgi:D-alanyl-D-alanine carboxypeptidase